MFEATTKSLSVSIALPGPISPSHEPGWLPFAGLRPAKWWLPVKPCVQSTALRPSGGLPAVGLVGDRRLGQTVPLVRGNCGT